MSLTNGTELAKNMKNIYNIQNNNSYKPVNQPTKSSDGSTTQEFIPSSARSHQDSDLSIFLTQSGDGTKTVEFKYRKSSAPGEKNKDKTYKFSDAGKTCELDEENRHVLYQSDGTDFVVKELTPDLMSEQYYDYDEGGNLVQIDSKTYSGKNLEETTVYYSEDGTRIITTKKVDNGKMPNSGEKLSPDSRYELEYMSQESFVDGKLVSQIISNYENEELANSMERQYRDGKLLHDFQDTDGDGTIDYAEVHNYSYGQLVEDIYRDSNNPKENRTVSYFYDENGRQDKTYVIYENTDEDYVESYEYYDDKRVKTIDRKKNDGFNFIQRGIAEGKKLLGDTSDFDIVETTYYNGLRTETEYTYVEEEE